jgi:hypothetical protein
VKEISEADLTNDLVKLAKATAAQQREPGVNPRELHAVVLFYKTEPPEVFVRKQEPFREVPAGEDYAAVPTSKLIRADHVGVVIYNDANGKDPYWWWSNGMRFHSP